MSLKHRNLVLACISLNRIKTEIQYGPVSTILKTEIWYGLMFPWILDQDPKSSIACVGF